MTEPAWSFFAESVDRPFPAAMAAAVEYIGKNLTEVCRWALWAEALPRGLYELLEDYWPDYYVFGNDGYQHEARTRNAVKFLRMSLERDGYEEVGFCVSDDGKAWLLAISAQKEKVAEFRNYLDGLLTRASDLVCRDEVDTSVGYHVGGTDGDKNKNAMPTL